MSVISSINYDFISAGLPPDTFTVVNFKGSEGLSRLYEFEIRLVSEDPDVDPDRVINNRASLIINREKGRVIFHGWPVVFEEGRKVGGFYYYRLVLAPRFYWLKYTFHQQVMLDRNLSGVLTAVLEDGGLAADDYELRLREDYPVHEYVCQYEESHFNFISRWMEMYGAYYFFEQGPDKEKLIITDTALSHVKKADQSDWIFSPPSGLEADKVEEILTHFHLSQKPMPQSVLVKDYNYEKPSLDISGRAGVKASGRGEFYFYGDYFQTPEQGARQAEVRAQEFLCSEKEYSAESQVPYISPGFVYDLTGHYQSSFNRSYLVAAASHEGRQSLSRLTGLGLKPAKAEDRPVYKNSFSAIEAGVQFRPPRVTPKPRIAGTLPAHVDSAGGDKYADLDEQGRYKIILPFDLSGRSKGKASHWVRLAQPHAGPGYGFHAPLHKGVEVALTFIDGDPDRPVIAGALPNPDNPSPVTSSSQTLSRMHTSGGNKLEINDAEGSKSIFLTTPTAQTRMSLGKISQDILEARKPGTPAPVGGGADSSSAGGGATPTGTAGSAPSSGPSASFDDVASALDDPADPGGLVFLNSPDGRSLGCLGRLDPRVMEELEELIEEKKVGNGAYNLDWSDIGNFFKGLGQGVADLVKSLWEANADCKGWSPFEKDKEGFALSSSSSWGKYVGQDLTMNIGGNSCEVIVGGEETFIGGFKMVTVSPLYISIVLGGRMVMKVPAKWQLKNIKDESEVELLEAMNEQIELIDEKKEALVQRLEALNQKAEALNEQDEAAGQKIELLNEKIEAVNNSTRTMGQKVKAAEDSVKAVNTKNTEAGSLIQALTSKTEAVNTKKDELGLALQQVGQKTEAVASLRVDNAELFVDDSEIQEL